MNTELLHLGEIRKLFSKDSADYDPKIGIEVEKVGLYYDRSDPPNYGGSQGYLAVLGTLYEQLGWEIVQQKGKRITSMKRGKAYLHLESDGRIELAGSPHDSIHNLARELRIHQNEIAEISKIYGIVWIGSGYHPFVKSAELKDVMDDRKRNFSGYMSFRSHVAHENSLPQFEIPRNFYESDFGIDAWIEHVLSLPLLMIQRGEKWLKPNCSFRQFLKQGYEGHNACMNDFELHMKSVWKDVKAKSVIELRFIDSLPPYLIPSVAALVKGLAYDEYTLSTLDKMTKSWRYLDFMNLRNDVAKHGLRNNFGGDSILDIAKNLIEMAKTNLKKNAIRDIEQNDESIHLRPIEDFVFLKEKSPAEWLVENWMGKWRKSFFPVVDWLQY